MKTPDIVDVLVDITEHDLEIFKALFWTSDTLTWTYEAENSDTQVNITFRKSLEE